METIVSDLTQETFEPKKHVQGVIAWTKEAHLQLGVAAPHGINARGKVRVETHSTYYGVENNVTLSTIAGSCSGLAADIIDVDGVVDHDKLSRFLHATAGGAFANKSRVNELVNGLSTRKSENYTSLFYNLIRMYGIVRHVELNDVQGTWAHRNITITKVELDSLPDAADQNKFGFAVKALFFGGKKIKAGCPNDYTWLRDLVEQVREKFGSDQKEVTIRLRFWETRVYDDGHHSIDAHRFEAAGFKDRLYYCPEDFLQKFVPQENFSYKSTSWPTTEEAWEQWVSTDLVMRRNGMSPEQMAVLRVALTSFGRRTPLACDSKVPRLAPDNMVIMGPTPEAISTLSLSSRLILSVISNVVASTRASDDALVAYRMMSYTYAQPDPDSLESHVWFNFRKEIHLPQFNAWRGLHACFTSGEPFVILPSAIDFTKEMTNHMAMLYCESYPRAALVSWADYLVQFNTTKEIDDIERHADRPFENSSVGLHANFPGRVSLVTGRATNSFIWPGVGLEYGERSTLPPHANWRLIVDKLEKESVPPSTIVLLEGGVSVLTSNVLPAPPGEAVVLGMDSSALQGTPYCANVIVKPISQQVRRNTLIRSSQFMDLWGWGVLSRFLGNDISYKFASSKDGPFKMFASNDSQIARPPHVWFDEENPLQYLVLSVEERANIWGSIHFSTMLSEVSFSWSVSKMTAHDGATRRDPVCGVVHSSWSKGDNMRAYLSGIDKLTMQVQATLAREETSGFRLAPVTRLTAPSTGEAVRTATQADTEGLIGEVSVAPHEDN